MNENFKTGNSFFMWIKIPMSYIGIGEIKYWFHCLAPKVAMYRLIVDDELDNAKANLKQREEYYPGTKVISVVMNPWARVRLGYLDLKNNNNPMADCDFISFVKNLPKLKSMTIPNQWWHPLDQQIDWIQYTKEDGTIRKADYIFKVENLEEDFKIIQDYFECYESLVWFTPIPEYRETYDDETKTIVSELFAKDIKEFRYEF
jgi:hypothetical protein